MMQTSVECFMVPSTRLAQVGGRPFQWALTMNRDPERGPCFPILSRSPFLKRSLGDSRIGTSDWILRVSVAWLERTGPDTGSLFVHSSKQTISVTEAQPEPYPIASPPRRNVSTSH